MISYVIPTRNRPQRLKQTLGAIGLLGDHAAAGGAEVIVVDNASEERAILPRRLSSGVPVMYLDRPANEGAAARNHGVAAARGEWIVMLDDDSFPSDAGLIDAIRGQGADVVGVAAEIHLTRTIAGRRQREAGGLPEVFIGCGVAIRRDAFVELGGYDPAFGYYAEEYDLSAKVLGAGGRIAFDRRFRVTHAKEGTNRDMNLIVSRLVRNNGWVMQRYAPDSERREQVRETCRRYRGVAINEGVTRGYAKGLIELKRTIRAQPRAALSRPAWERFIGLAAAREALQRQFSASAFRSAGIVDEGKNAFVVARALEELGVRIAPYGEEPEVQVVGTMSPGPMLDAYEARLRARRNRGPRVLAPWEVALGETVSPNVRPREAA